tara:strand:- start:175 stop:558 length:384 start_codon:yes stop_codon:yes gene_type:complete
MQKENAQFTDAVQAVSAAIANALALGGQPPCSVPNEGSDKTLRKAVVLALYKGFNLGREATIDALPTSVNVDVYEGDLNISGAVEVDTLADDVDSSIAEAEADDYVDEPIVESIIAEATQPTQPTAL